MFALVYYLAFALLIYLYFCYRHKNAGWKQLPTVQQYLAAFHIAVHLAESAARLRIRKHSKLGFSPREQRERSSASTAVKFYIEMINAVD